MAQESGKKGIYKMTPEEAAAAANEFKQLPHLAADFFPFTPAGFGTVTGLTFFCTACEGPMPPEYVRLRHNQFPDNVNEIRAIGVCKDCRCLTRFMFRFREDGHMESLVGHQWRRFKLNEKPSGWKRVLRWLLPFGAAP
ncbi:hypothetical protein FHR99_003169 [Litorivivens lipolytica]|uniref:Uncharacterized protein n=1 Tax=Litorivivens lipolytica TaxID=1524264 RepID=A0A7W4W7M4_9GAMM|nr:hypothetical protein [Litorivivens lipolytica]MBB3048895.1 hypothetical protein [Litorivivens lipolytica]